MRNLRNLKHGKFKFKGGEPTAVAVAAWDASDDSIILAFGPAPHNPSITLKRLDKNAKVSSEATTIASWDAPSPLSHLPVDRILDLHCFSDSKAISLVLEGGDIVVVRDKPAPEADKIEIVGSVDSGVRGAAWSPDEEILSVFTAADTCLLMTRDFESIANVPVTADDTKVSDHVSVGWGKKETQFRGRGVAKALRDPTVPEHVDEGTLSSIDDGRVTIAWRGDAQCFALNSFLDTDPRRRILRMYSREGLLESVSEPVNGLEGALSWMPSGQLIAGLQRKADKIDIVFFERNGLRHGDFSLRLSKSEMATIGSSIDLRWNIDSTVLAVSLKDRLQLWTIGNYHYYLKHEVRFRDDIDANVRAFWHPERALQLCCFQGNTMRKLTYNFEVCRGPVIPPHDSGIVAVIDGARLLVTPLRTANVPPPMAFDEIDLPDTALDAAISDKGRQIAVLHHGKISIWRCNYEAKPASKATFEESYSIEIPSSDEVQNRDHTITISANRQELHVRTDHDRIDFVDQTSDGYPALDAPKIVRNITNASRLDWHSQKGNILEFEVLASGVAQIRSDLQTLRIQGCTSWILTQSHFIYTTSQHLLKFIHVNDGELEIPADAPEKDERCRTVERGAKIVTVMPSAYSLVLQMPRGNLETIYPRALVLAGIRHSIDAKEYRRAFTICRTHKVDMNILHDYKPKQFMEDIELFVKDVKKANFIDLFLSSLIEDDVSETLYQETLASVPRDQTSNNARNGGPHEVEPSTKSKVNAICDAFLQVLSKHSSAALQTIVTAHICKNPPDLENGLRLVAEVRRHGNEEQLDQAIDHICFLADVNQLYDTALALYDLDVALLVAQQSQKDPREYLPYLQSLQEMEQLRRQFTIDNNLKRYHRALKHLHEMDAFDELKAYMTKHELHDAAIDLYRYDGARLAELMLIFASFLCRCNRFKEAGIAYESISDYAGAYEAYRAVNMWQECLSNAALVPLLPREIQSLARDLAGSLEEAKDFGGAAAIHLDHLDDLEGGIKLQCRAYQFASAIRQVTRRQRPELLKSVIDPSVIEVSATMTEMLAEMSSQLSAQLSRLHELRRKKEDDPIAFLDGAEAGNDDVPDNISLAPTDASTSGGTFMTRYTNRSMGTLATNATRKTSKNKRREERKRARGKKGTVYEEEYLVNSMARLIERLNSVLDDVAHLVTALMRRNMRERAMAVQNAVIRLETACTACMDDVFRTQQSYQVEPSGSGLRNSGQTPEDRMQRPVGGEGVLWDAMAAPPQAAPVLRTFERLSLV